MKMSGQGPLTPINGSTAGAAAPVAAAAPVSGTASAAGADGVSTPTTTGGPALQAGPLTTDLMKPAQAAMADMPEVDPVRVAALREALANGEIRFDANRLAQLIQRFHGGHS
ncbi:flagellar biosynthesis anti-sigma factor FlgM [Roseateles amylovorans]|uniref:Negative regulator of flagellin synthesis n=1 Tax=Roseateles amylovorans TaxID=2978473 RepID=A0ABY6AWB7_9BURK|nr:flagellar biosynthesis anti-sigma factor FlgM [Roseateles amylovorans]UXH76890.1 flagellar biosynthesis anti-sigma factor FlgM [Roseateles amylovorans]